MPLFLVTGDSGDLDLSFYVEADDAQAALDMHAAWIAAEFDVAGDQLDCPRNVWTLPAPRGVNGILVWLKDVIKVDIADTYYREDDDATDGNPFEPESPEGRAWDQGRMEADGTLSTAQLAAEAEEIRQLKESDPVIPEEQEDGESFFVIIEATSTMEIVVKAADANAARDIAHEIYVQSEDMAEFTETEFNWEIVNVEPES